jgi:hypothetical protein
MLTPARFAVPMMDWIAFLALESICLSWGEVKKITAFLCAIFSWNCNKAN